MTTLADLAEANPDIQAQRDEWAAARSANGENAASWSAFRAHLQALGAPDPGEDKPDDWVGPDFEGDTD
jgi:hypothetical protein